MDSRGDAALENLIRVFWLDIYSDPEWRSQEKAEALEPVSCETVGFEVLQTAEKLVIAATKSPDGYGEVVAIPMGCIVKIETIGG